MTRRETIFSFVGETSKIPAQPHENPLLPDGPSVEAKLLALKNVPITTTALTRSARNNSVQTTSLELPFERLLNLAVLLEPLLLLLLNGVALLLVGGGLSTGLGSLLATELGAVVCFVPLTEGRSVDLYDSRLGQGVCADELVVRRVVRDADDADLARDTLGSPGEVAGVEAQRAELAVAAARTD